MANARSTAVRRPHSAAEPTLATTPPIRYWAFFGAVMLAFIAYVLIRWVTGPYWEHVDSGPTPVPEYMKIAIRVWEVAGILGVIATYWYFLWRPWRRAREVTTDGIIVLACSFLWFQDPLSNYLGYWFTYNTEFVNMGSWVNSVPGWMAGGEPGATLVEPLLWVIPFYIYGWMPWLIFGCWVMRKAKERWPTIKNYQLVLVAWLAVGLVDVFVEGFLFIPLGFFQYGGGFDPSIFPDSYHTWPLLNIIFIGAIVTGLTCLRYFKNDKGETLAERGLSSIQGSNRKKLGLRFLAMVGATQAVLIAFNIVVGLLYGGHTERWPDDVQSRSYFTSGICGEGTNRACGGPNIPNLRGSDTIRVDPNGKLYIPPDARGDVPKKVPRSDEAEGPFNGPLF